MSNARSLAATVFRVVAVAEALSWAGLLAGMFVKYVLQYSDGGVPVFGMVHGIVFIAYVLAALVAFRVFGWNLRTLAMALAASVPPLLTWPFEAWALRSGKFDGPEVERSGGIGLFLGARA